MPESMLGDQLVHWTAEGDARILYIHGAPDDGRIWAPFLERSGGVAVDLPGFGHSGKRGDGDYSFQALGRFVSDFLDHLGWQRARLCMHDWGGVGLLAAAAAGGRGQVIERLALIDGMTFAGPIRWHRVARMWRTPVLGELIMGFNSRWAMRRGGIPEAHLDHVVECFDAGTQRAMLRLYRSADPVALEAAGAAALPAIAAPALIVWGERDPFARPRAADALAAALGGGATVRVVPGAGHWPWLDDPSVVEDVVAFLTA